MSRVPEPAELADDVAEIRRTQAADMKAIRGELAEISAKLERSYLPREVYDARHSALRTEIALEMASIKAQSSNARSLSLWAVGIITTAAIIALVSFVATAGAAA